MKGFVISSGIVILLLILPILYRAVQGPTIIDRMIALNIIGTKTTILLLIIGSLFREVDLFIDLALTYALLNFIGSLAAARFIQRRKTAVPAKGGVEELL